MNAKEFERRLEKFARGTADVDQRIRGLRDGEDIMPTARGRHAPDIDAKQAALMVLTLIPCRAVEGAKIALRVAKLPVIPKPDSSVQGTFGDYLVELIGNVGGAYRAEIDRIEFNEFGSIAHVYFNDKTKLMFSDEEGLRQAVANDPSNYSTTGQFRCERRFCISCGFIDQIGIEITSGGESGEWVK